MALTTVVLPEPEPPAMPIISIVILFRSPVSAGDDVYEDDD